MVPSVPLAPRVGLGCMRLSTVPKAGAGDPIAVVHAALDAGIRLLDTADVYAPDDRQLGHNERLVARALASWAGERATVTVATKGGLTRPGGRWRPDGRAKHLQAACEASLEALGVGQLDLYLLHAVDPATPLETSVRALGRLRDQGLVAALGLCNVTVAELDRARQIAPIDAVQVALSPFDDTPLRNGVAEYCAEHGLTLMAHSPFGGPKKAPRLGRDAVLKALAERRGVTPAQAALAWLLDLSEVAVPLAGTCRVAHAREAAAATALRLTDVDRAELDAQFTAGRQLRLPRSARQPPPDAPGDVVVLMGMPAAGKTTAVAELVESGYERLNRDDQGGRLSDLVPHLDALLATGRNRVVLDNTYASRAERNRVIEVAWRHRVPARCVYLDTPLAEAQINAVLRMLARYDRLLTPDEMAAARDEPAALPPRAQFEYERALEPPVRAEGFRELERRPFTRRPDPNAGGRALFLDPDGLDPTCAGLLSEHAEAGWHLLGLGWEPDVGRGRLGHGEVEARYQTLGEQLGLALDVRYCPHPPGPPRCWCRKPLPGLVLSFARDYHLDLGACRFIVRSAADKTLAERLGIPPIEHEDFF